LTGAGRSIAPLLPLSPQLKSNVVAHHHGKPGPRPQGQHWAIVGKTGTGKTYFKKKLVAARRAERPQIRTYILDTKHLGDFSEKDGPIIKSDRAPDPLKTPGAILIWQPSDDIDEYDTFFTRILNAGDEAIVDVDETVNLKFGNRIPRGYGLILKQGRLPGISVINSTQEVAGAPREMFSQAKHLLAFRVNNAYDEMMLRHQLRLPKEVDILPSRIHGFFHIDLDSDRVPMEYSGCEEFFTKRRF
jgi:hypothetical protein